MTEEVGLRGYRVQDPARTLARRREIMLAMAEVIIDKGYASATLEDVAAHMGTSRAVIYYQFRSKEDLYAEIVVEAVSHATARLESIVAKGDPPERHSRSPPDLIAKSHGAANRSTCSPAAKDLTPDFPGAQSESPTAHTNAAYGDHHGGHRIRVFVYRDPRSCATRSCSR